MVDQKENLLTKFAKIAIGKETTASLSENKSPWEIGWNAVVESFLPATLALWQIKKERDEEPDIGALLIAFSADLLCDFVFIHSNLTILLKIAIVNPLLRAAAVLYAGEGKVDPNNNGQ